MDELLRRAAELAATYRGTLSDRPVAATGAPGFGGPLPDGPTDPLKVLEELATAAEPGLVATAGPRFFGFVVGGSLPAAVAADVLTSGWDQNAFSPALSPAAAAAEEVAGGWLKELLGLPSGA